MLSSFQKNTRGGSVTATYVKSPLITTTYDRRSLVRLKYNILVEFEHQLFADQRLIGEQTAHARIPEGPACELRLQWTLE